MRFLLVLSAALVALVTVSTAHAQRSVDPIALAEAKTLMEKIGVGALAQQVASAMMQQQRTVLEQANPGQSAAIGEILSLMDVEFTKKSPTFVEAFAGIYTLHFNTAELRELNAFYDSPIGRKLIKETPAMTSEGMIVGRAFGEQIATDVIRSLIPEMQKRNLKLGPSKT